MGEYLVEQILSNIGEQKSPIDGSKFQALSRDYKKIKKADGAGDKPNLENSGKMLRALDYKITEDGLKLGVFGKEAPIADGHNNLSGDSLIPERRFLPDKGETFKKDINKGIESIIAEHVADDVRIPKRDLQGVESKEDLYNVLRGTFGSLSKAEIKSAVLLSSDWYDALNDLDLLEWL